MHLPSHFDLLLVYEWTATCFGRNWSGGWSFIANSLVLHVQQKNLR